MARGRDDHAGPWGTGYVADTPGPGQFFPPSLSGAAPASCLSCPPLTRFVLVEWQTGRHRVEAAPAHAHTLAHTNTTPPTLRTHYTARTHSPPRYACTSHGTPLLSSLRASDSVGPHLATAYCETAPL